MRLTDALVSSLEFSKSKDAELAWLDAMMVTRNKSVAKPVTENMETDGIQSNGERKFISPPTHWFLYCTTRWAVWETTYSFILLEKLYNERGKAYY